MNESKKLLYTFGIVGLMVIGLLYMLYSQMKTIGIRPFKDNQSLVMQIQKQKQLEKRALEEIEQIEVRKVELRRLRGLERKVTQLLPTESKPELLLYYIQKKAQEAGVKPQMIKPGKSQNRTSVASNRRGRGRNAGQVSGAPKYEEWTYEMQLFGNYDQIARFINMMEEFQVTGLGGRQEVRFFAVKELTIKAEDTGLIEGGTHDCKLVMQTYRYTGQDEDTSNASGRGGR